MNLGALSKTDLIILLSRKPLTFDDADIYNLFCHVWNRLTLLEQAARQQKRIQEAYDFARFVEMGLLPLFRKCKSGPPLEVAPRRLEELVQQTLFRVQDTLNATPGDCVVKETELEALNRKLDRLILAYPAMLSIVGATD